MATQGLQVGDVLADRYKLVEEIGRGGFGVVFRATQLGMNRDVAVKLLHASAPGQEGQMRERFKREAMMARNLNHPHTIRQYDFGETGDGMMYLVLEFLDGENLVDTIRATGALGDDRVRRMASGVLKSLAEAHAQGIIHRDLKPANIMLCNVYGEKDYVKVLDFGIAKTMMGDTDLTAAGVALGSPRYMAPELLRGENPTPGCDVYSIAITFAEAVMGKPLIRAENSVEAAQLQLSPKPLPIPAELKESTLWPWLSIALKKDENERYESAEEMLRYLDASQEELTARGADFGEDAIVTTQMAKMEEDETNPSVETAAPAPQNLEEESDPEAPTIRVDSADVDAYLQSRGITGAAAATAAPDEATDDVPAPSFGGSDDVETSDQPAPNFARTKPVIDTDARPRLQNSGGIGVGADDNRMTAPLPTVDPTASAGGQDRSGPAFDSQLQLGDTDSEDQDLPTQMVSVEEAFGGQVPTHGAFAHASNGAQAAAEQETQEVAQLSPQSLAPGPQRTSGDGDQPTQMISVDEVDSYGQQRQNNPALQSSPQISGQAFATSAIPQSANTQFVEAVQGDTSGKAVETRKKYLGIIAVLFGLGILGLFGIFFVVITLMDKGKEEVQEPPKIVAPTPEPIAAPAETIEFKIYTTPKKAALMIDGSEKGETPAKFSLPSSRLPLEIELVLDGYESRTITLAQGGETTFEIPLEKIAKDEEPKPEPKPEAKPEPKPEPKPKPTQKPKPKPKPKPKDKPVVEIWD